MRVDGCPLLVACAVLPRSCEFTCAHGRLQTCAGGMAPAATRTNGCATCSYTIDRRAAERDSQSHAWPWRGPSGRLAIGDPWGRAVLISQLILACRILQSDGHQFCSNSSAASIRDTLARLSGGSWKGCPRDVDGANYRDATHNCAHAHNGHAR